MTVSRLKVVIALGISLILGDQTTAVAQTQASSTTNYRFAETNELTIVVNLLGAVRNPGRYELSRSIDLVNLLALAGGQQESADLSDVRITRTMRTSSRVERREIRVNVEKFNAVDETDLVLNQGDIIYVSYQSGVKFSDVLTYLTTAAVLTTAIVTVINQTRN
ncbi:MAG TPA: SLBB domain-containing protein [Bacteroidota bacterium]|nr:SLBB domain-containing protein [Bacteroidota bacterium]